MNLDEFRKIDFQGKFLYLLETVKFSVAQDQDYLNRLCKGRTVLVDRVWDRMPIKVEGVEDKNLKLILDEIFNRYYDDFIEYPAASKNHHNND